MYGICTLQTCPSFIYMIECEILPVLMECFSRTGYGISTSPNHTLLTSLMEEVESQADLCRVETGMLLRETTVTLHVEHHVSSIDTLDHKE